MSNDLYSNETNDLTYAQSIYKEALKCEKAKEFKKALELYQQAADKGSFEAMAGLGWCHIYGRGTETDKEKGLPFLQQAAEHGVARAQYELGNYYYSNFFSTADTGKDADKAFVFYMKAAEQGYADAEIKMGEILETDYLRKMFGVIEKQTIEWYRKAAIKGSVSAQKKLGKIYYEGYGDDYYKKQRTQDYKKAMEWYLKAAELGDIEAQVKMGDMYYEGVAFERDCVKAAEWYQRALEKDIDAVVKTFKQNTNNSNVDNETHVNVIRQSEAMVKLGDMYLQGEGVPQDYDKAFELYKKAERGINFLATVKLANMYHYGWGVAQDYGKAYEIYNLFSNTNDWEEYAIEATNQLAIMYKNGEGVEKDARKASRLFAKAKKLETKAKEIKAGIKRFW